MAVHLTILSCHNINRQPQTEKQHFLSNKDSDKAYADNNYHDDNDN